jgi:hypothetical protein
VKFLKEQSDAPIQMSCGYDTRFVVRCEQKIFPVLALNKTRVMDKEEWTLNRQGVGKQSFLNLPRNDQTNVNGKNEVRTAAHCEGRVEKRAC